MNGELLKKAEKLVRGCEAVAVACVTPDGYPRVTMLSRLGQEGLTTLYFSTGTDSRKTACIRANPKASVCACVGGDSVTLLGHLSIVYNRQTKEDVWQSWMIEHFPGGTEDPNYCVLRFEATEATIWIGGEFVTVPLIG